MKNTIGTLLALATITSAPAAISLSSHDNFTTDANNWTGGAVPPTHSPDTSWDGNPGHLINTSDGIGQNGRFHFWNDDPEWQGDYLSANVTAISLWVDNRSNTPNIPNIPLSIAFNGPGGWFISNSISITDSILDTDEWQEITFDISEAGLTYVTGGTNDYTATLSDVTRFEILSSLFNTPSLTRNGFLQGDNTLADIRFDDITAIPEPSTSLLAGLSALGLLARRKRR